MKNKLIKLIALALVLLPVNLYAREDVYTGDIPDIPKSISIREVGLDNDNFISGDTVTGKIKIYSNEDEVIAGYKLSFELRKIDSKDNINKDKIDQARILNIYHSSKELVIKPNSETIENFEYKIPKVLPEGDYYLRVLLRNPVSYSLSWESISLGFISGSNNSQKYFVDLTKNILLRKSDKSENSLNTGISINKDEDVVLRGEAKLEGEQKNITVYPKLIVYERAAGEKIVYESKNLESISLQKGKTQFFEIPVPKLTDSGGYFAELVLEKDYQAISNIVDFHWVVGGESGRIINLTLNRANFEKGEEAIIDMQLADRADLQFSTGDIKSLGEVKVITTLSCDKNYTKTVENLVNLNDKRSLEVKIPIDKKVDNCTVKTDLLKNDKQLHSKTLAYIADIENQKTIESENNNIVTYIGIGLILIIMIGLVFMKRKKIFGKLFIMLGFLLLSSISYNNALAGPCTALTINIDDPKPSPYEYEYGENISLSGNAFVSYCTNYPSDAKLAFYLDTETEPFYIRDYYVPSSYGNLYSNSTNSLSFGIETISTNPLAPGWHTVRVDWFQDCTRQGEGTANGSITRYFYVKPPKPSFRISQEKVEIGVGDEFQYKALYDSDGPNGVNPEEDVTAMAVWSIKTGVSNIQSIGPGKFEGLAKGDSTIEVEYLGEKSESDITIRAVNDPYVIITVKDDPATLIYPAETELTAKLVEFSSTGVKTETIIDDTFIVQWISLNDQILKVNKVVKGKAYVKGVLNKNGRTQVQVVVQKNLSSPVYEGVSNPIEVRYPGFRINPTIFATNSDSNTDKNIQFRSFYDEDGIGSLLETDVTNNSIWSSSDPKIKLVGNGEFLIPASFTDVGVIEINSKYTDVLGNLFKTKADLYIKSIGTPLKGSIRILSIKGREIKVYVTAEGGKPLYTFTEHKVKESLTNIDIPLESSYITDNGIIYTFKIQDGVTVPKKIKVQAKVTDTGGAFDYPTREFTYLGEGSIREINL